MSISHYIKEIGRGKEGARALPREQAADLMGQVLDGGLTDLEVGAFCLAMRIKGETPTEMAGFLDATQARLQQFINNSARPAVVIPSYNGARKLPLLTPLLALLLAREGLAVLVHGAATEARRVDVAAVLAALDIPAYAAAPGTPQRALTAGTLTFAPTGLLCPGLQRLLEVRRVVGLRNPGHSVVKLMQPVRGRNLLVSSYTHPEYAISMAATIALTQQDALLLRGTEGEAVADARRLHRVDGFVAGQRVLQHEPQPGSLVHLPELPKEMDAQSTAAYIRRVLAGRSPVPAPITQQVEHILLVLKQMGAAAVRTATALEATA